MREDIGLDEAASSGPVPAIASSEEADGAVFVGVELGGTKAIAVIGRGDTILDSVSIPTTTPEATLGALAAQLGAWSHRWHPAALGIASFGPIAIHRDQPAYGHMLRTPKPGWSGADIVGPLSASLPGPHRIHTDVTAAALAEGRWGAGVGQSDIVYVTIGTGIGMGVIANGQPVAGNMHPEAGHIRVRRMPGDTFAGICPFHGDCLEGLVCGPAIAARCGVPAPQLSPDDPRWAFVADAIAEAFSTLILTLAPKSIIIGGGVGLGQPHLLPLIRAGVAAKLGHYLPSVDRESLDALIVTAKLEARAGPLGSLILAQIAKADGDHKTRFVAATI